MSPRLFRLELEQDTKVAERGEWVDGEWNWKWNWRTTPRGRAARELQDLIHLISGVQPTRGKDDKTEWILDDSKEFNVKRMREIIEEHEGGSSGNRVQTLWSKIIPKKIDIFMWRVRLGRLPCRMVLDKMGIDLDTVLCPRCGETAETLDHALIGCSKVKLMWLLVGRWWRKNLDGMSTIQQFLLEENQSRSIAKGMKLLFGVKWAFLYLIWSNRNKVVFKAEDGELHDVFFEFQRKAFEWFSGRIGKAKMDWTKWLTDPTTL